MFSLYMYGNMSVTIDFVCYNKFSFELSEYRHTLITFASSHGEQSVERYWLNV